MRRPTSGSVLNNILNRDGQGQQITKLWLEVEVVSAAGLHDQEHRLGDGLVNLMRGSERKLRPYVEVTMDDTSQTTHRRSEKIKNVEKNGTIDFSRSLCFPWPESATASGKSHTTIHTTGSSASLYSEGEKMATVKIFDFRKLVSVIRGDPLIGEAELPLPPPDYDTSQPAIEHLLYLKRGAAAARRTSTMSQVGSQANMFGRMKAPSSTMSLEAAGAASRRQDEANKLAPPPSIDDFLAPGALDKYAVSELGSCTSIADTDELPSNPSSDTVFASPLSSSGYQRMTSTASSLLEGGTHHGQVLVRLKMLDLGPSFTVLANSVDYSLQKVAGAIAEILKISGLVNLLLDMRPKELAGGDEEQSRTAVQEVLEELFSQVTVSPDPMTRTNSEDGTGSARLRARADSLGEKENESAVLRRLSHLARGILNLVAEAMKQNLGKGIFNRGEVKQGALQLAVMWIQTFMKQIVKGAIKSGAAQMASDTTKKRKKDERLQRFFASAQIEMQDLEPIDKENHSLDCWPALLAAAGLASAVEQVPQSAQLGQGSFGIVWRAQDKHTRTRYAVKNMKITGVGFEVVAARECEIANHLCKEPHPCIVEIFCVGCFETEECDLFYIVMEICAGGDLSDRIQLMRVAAKQAGEMYSPPEQWRRWIGHILLGLEHLHCKMNTLLRDLKPENVVINLEDHAKLTDFGFSRIGTETEGGFGTFGVPPGTPHYISPEVVLGKEYDATADLFSLGVLVWVLMTGGVNSKRAPVPPCAEFSAGYSKLSTNSGLLADCISDPMHHDANPVQDADASDFIIILTKPDPADRPKLDAVRCHKLLQPLHLPPSEAEYPAVIEWMRSREKSS